MNVIILGSGGREHALAWKIAQSPLLEDLYIAPGNSGTGSLGTNVPLEPSNFPGLVDFIIDKKIKIVVEDAPFLITQWRWSDSKLDTMILTTNVNDEFELNTEHPMLLGGDDSLYVEVRHGLLAKVHRNVYYQWVDMATEQKKGGHTEITILSAGQPFVLGSYN